MKASATIRHTGTEPVKNETGLSKQSLPFEDNTQQALQLKEMVGLVRHSPRTRQERNLFSSLPAAGGDDNSTGLPGQLKAGVEHLSGMDLSHVQVHYNSPKPGLFNALACAQGADIHLAPGQEKHLPHEAWHVVQQAQRRVKPTLQLRGVKINDNHSLEREADVMGARAAQGQQTGNTRTSACTSSTPGTLAGEAQPLQMKTVIKHWHGTYNGQVPRDCPKEKVGLKMKAKLDPLDPVKGSATDPKNTDMYRELWQSNGIVRGHLLNHDLGGFGVAENLFPITSGANSRHSKEVECKVKNLLVIVNAHNTKIDKECENWGSHHHVIYTVNVKENSHDTAFECAWYQEDGEGKQVGDLSKQSIKSTYIVNKKSDPWAGCGSGQKLTTWSHGKNKGTDGWTNASAKIFSYFNDSELGRKTALEAGFTLQAGGIDQGSEVKMDSTSDNGVDDELSSTLIKLLNAWQEDKLKGSELTIETLLEDVLDFKETIKIIKNKPFSENDMSLDNDMSLENEPFNRALLFDLWNKDVETYNNAPQESKGGQVNGSSSISNVGKGSGGSNNQQIFGNTSNEMGPSNDDDFSNDNSMGFNDNEMNTTGDDKIQNQNELKKKVKMQM